MGMESSGMAPQQEGDLQAIRDILEKKGIDPEKALEAINNFKEAQKKLSDSIAYYNEQASKLAEANGYSITKEQEAIFPEKNMTFDPDLKTYYRLTKSSNPENKDEGLPMELL